MTADARLARDLHVLALELATEAATEIRRTVDEAAPSIGDGVTRKSTPTDLVTVADRETERRLVARILERRPDDAILGEEGGERPGRSRVRWVLDPIDGTVNFVLGLPQFAVSVAAQVDGRTVAGAVANPVTGEVFHALVGAGAWLRHGESRDSEPRGSQPRGSQPRGDVELHGTRTVPLERAVVATGFGYDAGMRGRQAAVVARLMPRIGDIRRLGAAALDLCCVAAGRVDGYFEAGLHPWDHAAGALIAAEAGAVVTGVGDGPPERLLVAAGPALVDDLVRVLAELGADRVGE